MKFLNHAIQNITNFSGRTRREDFWKTIGLVFVINLLIGMMMPLDFGLISGTLSFIFNIVAFILTLSLSIRRLHDTGKSGWWLLIGLTGIGMLVIVYFWLQDSDKGPNEYGLSPKYDNSEYSSFREESAMYNQNPRV